MKEFGEVLKYLRNEKGLTQTKLAKEFCVSQRTICAWEKDLQEPSLSTLVVIAKFFDVEADFLLGRIKL